jgi:hypothetical protein
VAAAQQPGDMAGKWREKLRNETLPLKNSVTRDQLRVKWNQDLSFTGTNVVTPNGGKQFYILSNTNNN